MGEQQPDNEPTTAAGQERGAPVVTTSIFDRADADLVDAIFAYILDEFPEMKQRVIELKEATRREFGGDRSYVSRRSPEARKQLAENVMSLFNGRNATEIARRLGIGRATVYRIIKTEGKPK